MKKIKEIYGKTLYLVIALFVIILAIFICDYSIIGKYFSILLGTVFLILSIFVIIDSIRDMKKSFLGIFLYVLGYGFMLMMSIMFIVYPFVGDNKNTKADGFTIEGYTVNLDVGLDNKVNVTEEIDVKFYESGHHGIYKFTPLWYEYTGKDNKTIRRRSNIIDYRSVDNKYEVETVNGKKKIKMGSEYLTVYGPHKYTIKYTYDMGSDPFKGFDEFIFHAFGDYWGTEINNPKIVIQMPKDIGDNNINVYTDKYRKNKVNSSLNIEKNGNTITITNKNLDLTKALTVDIELPENYFSLGSNNYSWISFMIIMIVLIVTGYIIYMWSKYGKDNEKRVPTVEFYSPDNLNSAEIGYIFNKGQNSNKLAISLIIELASKGYIKINKLDKKKIQIVKVDEENENIDLAKMDDLEKIVYDKLFDDENNIILNEHKTFYQVFKKIGDLLNSRLNSKIYDSVAKNKRIVSLTLTVLVFFLSLMAFSDIKDLSPNWNYLYYVGFLCIGVDILFTLFMPKKTSYGEMIYARVIGFRDFLVTAEKEKLENLVEDNPHYFYDILPYTFVLNVSKKWISKFQDIKMPESDMGDFDITSSDLMLSSIASSTSSGSSGGCSSCGGGCSSCGGGGSW